MYIRQSRFRQPCPNLTAIVLPTVPESPADHNRSILAVCVCQEISRARGLTPEFRFFFQTAQPGCGEGSSTHSSPTSPVVRAQQVNRPEVQLCGLSSMHCHASRLPPSPIQVFKEATMHNIKASMSHCIRLAAIREPGWTIRSGRSKSCKLDILHHMVLLSDCVNSVTRMAHLAENLKPERRGSPLPTRT